MLESELRFRFSKDQQKTRRIIPRVTREKYSQLFRNFWSIGGKSKRKTENRVEEHRAVTRLENFNPPSSLFENIRKLEQSDDWKNGRNFGKMDFHIPTWSRGMPDQAKYWMDKEKIDSEPCSKYYLFSTRWKYSESWVSNQGQKHGSWL